MYDDYLGMIVSVLKLFDGKMMLSDILNMPLHFLNDLVKKYAALEKEISKKMERMSKMKGMPKILEAMEE